MQKLKLQQKLLQKLSPQQIQLMRLLQVPTVMLEQRIKQEIEENPALEEDFGDTDDMEAPYDTDDEQLSSMERDEDDADEGFESIANDEFDFSDYLDEDDIPAYRLAANNTSADDEQKDVPFASGISFHDFLLTQLGMQKLTEREQIIATHIIGNIDDSGYLQREISSLVDDLAFNQNISTTNREVISLLKLIQEFEPPGIAARNLQECLLLQIRRKTPKSEAIDNATVILEKSFKEFTRKHYYKIVRRHKISDNQLRLAIDEILTLNPKPGNSIGETIRAEHHIVPDFYISINDRSIELSLNSGNTPELKINRTYSEMLETMSDSKGKLDPRQKEAVFFVKQKLESAKWFIDAIKQRQNTLLVTMRAIINYQKVYFLTGDETKLRPMILKDIAELVNLDISTVSRVANSKYAQTPYGTFLLKSFFSESMQNEAGEEISTREVKKIMQDCIESEDKFNPVTDEELTNILKDKGYNVARRTVAKYREQLDIPVARLRKEL